MRRGVGYVRVSRVGGRGGESFISPELQRERITLAASGNDVEIVQWFEDLDHSGGKWERPGFQAALETVERGDAQVVVVARLTRFARSVLDTHRALARLEDAGGALLAADVNVDVSTSTGRLIRGVLATLAEFELDVARENWNAAKLSAVSRGIKIAARAPFGYRFDESHRLEPDPDTAQLIPLLFERRASGSSRRELVRFIHEQTGTWVRDGTVGDIIRNRSYRGEVRYGDLLKEDAHPALVNEDLWQRAQATNVVRRPTGEGTLLAGVLVCAGCGRRMIATTGSLRADGTRRLMYRCQKISRDGPCPSAAAVIRERADEHITALFLAWAEANDTPFDLDDAADTALAAALEELRHAQAELGAYIAAVQAVVAPAAFRTGAEERQRAVDEAAAAVTQARVARAGVSVRATVRGEWPALSEQDRRRLIAAAIEKVVVHRASSRRRVDIAERCEVVWR